MVHFTFFEGFLSIKPYYIRAGVHSLISTKHRQEWVQAQEPGGQQD
jgi:hypothetical protein